MRLKIKHIAFLVALCSTAMVEARPRLAVNIVISGLRQSDIARYEKNFCKDGFLRLRNEGMEFAECYANYAPTTPEAGLATFATGTTPAIHGIFSSVCYDRTFNKEVALCSKAVAEDNSIRKEVEVSYSTQPFVAQTLAEVVVASSPHNRAITIAHNPLSAMILAGRRGECYWLSEEGKWSSADCYTELLPSWVQNCNRDEINRIFATDTWYGRYTNERYLNTRATDITIYEKGKAKQPRSQRKMKDGWVESLRQMPSGNLAIFEFAKRAIGALLPLHIDDKCKVLNICLDVPRTIAEKYGTDSVEYEDMLYSLDASLADFITFLYAQSATREDVLLVVTSDSGMSPTVAENGDASRFNTRQFEVIMNAFLSARYGQDNWVLGYSDGSLYLNHDVIYRHKKSLTEVQNEVATFALQYRGIAATATATAMRSAQFSSGTMAMIQNGYSPRRSGDVLVVLDPERIELDYGKMAMSGSAYAYDRHIPLFILGGDTVPFRIERRVTSDQIAPSLAKILGVDRPQCSDAEILITRGR
ncbi:MAG: alkaline phosphatase family protein [Alistipes sp.]|nr:alkaline phosphatase family protein [Alistipes sp.]